MDEVETETSYLDKGRLAFESYGWHLLILTVVLGFAYTKLKPYIDSYLQYRSDQAYAAKYHKDPDLAAARIAAQQQLIAKLQDNYNKEADKYLKKLEEKENKKREDWLERNEGTATGNRLGHDQSKDKSSKSLKPEYNPLMGNSSRNYRPPKKSCCGGGGCG